MHIAPYVRCAFRFAFLAAFLAALSGCAGTSGSDLFPGLTFGKPAEDAQPSEAKTEPACGSAEKCAAVLKKLVASPNHDWIGASQPAAFYADGTRLFAYRALRPKMTCPELRRALEETRTVAPKLTGAAMAGTRTLMTKVGNELRAERQARCKPKPKAS